MDVNMYMYVYECFIMGMGEESDGLDQIRSD